MSAIPLLEFDDFCDLLIPLGAINSPAELHGVLCGKLCGGAALTAEKWLAVAWELLDIVDQPHQAVEAQVLALLATTEAQLRSGDYDLQLFIPDDAVEMEIRAQALSQWCHGFLSGFGSAGIAPDTEFSGEQADALRDMAAIVQVSIDHDEVDIDTDQQEADFMELVEYVRILAMNFYEDHQHRQIKHAIPTTTSEKTLH